jgi:hypothetical protein
MVPAGGAVDMDAGHGVAQNQREFFQVMVSKRYASDDGSV